MRVKLKEIGKIVTGNTPSKQNTLYYNSNDILFIKPDVLQLKKVCDINDSKEFISENARAVSRIVPKGSLLITCIGIIGKIGIVGIDECAFNQQINAIVPNNNIKSKYLAYVLFYNRGRLNDIANAPVVPIINKSEFENFEVNIIGDIKKQESIIQILDKIENIIYKYECVLNHLDTLIKARFVEMFGDIDDVKKWERKKWQEVVEIRNGKDYKKVLVKKGGYPVYGTGGEMARASEYLCPENTIVVGRKGSINNPLLVKEKFWNVDTAFGVVAKKELNYHYLYQFCKSFNFMKLNKATTLPSTTKEDLLKIEINLPPIELQNQFAAFVKKVDKLKFDVQKSLEKTQMLFDSLMQKYFD